MRSVLLILLTPVMLMGESIEAPVDFSRGPKPEISPQIRNRWMGGEEALEREMIRSQEIFARHQFPLGTALLIAATGLLLWLLIGSRKVVASKIKERFFPPPTPAEKAQKKLEELDRVSSLEERYRLLGLIIRESLKDRYDIPADVQTKEENLEDIKESRDDYKEIFNAVDSVEFENKTPSERHFQDLKKRMQRLLK